MLVKAAAKTARKGVCDGVVGVAGDFGSKRNSGPRLGGTSAEVDGPRGGNIGSWGQIW